MINGFILEINNKNGIEYEIPLFRGFTLPDGLSIKTKNGDYTYDSLLLMAKSKNFIGGGFQSDLIKKVNLITRQGVLHFDSSVISLDNKIIIDGYENYLSILVPPNNSGFFQLLPNIKPLFDL